MEMYTEKHKTKKALFKRVDEILKQSGMYNIEEDKVRKKYTLTYWFNKANVYKVIKGEDDDEFCFNNMPYAIDDYEEEIYLKKGCILLLEAELEDKVWFTCSNMLIGKKAMETYAAEGYTDYGSLTYMLDQGLIEKVVPADSHDQEAEKIRPIAAPIEDAPTLEEMLTIEPIVNDMLAMLKAAPPKKQQPPTKTSPVATLEEEAGPEDMPSDYGSFEAIRSTLDLLKKAVGNIPHIYSYSSPEKEECIRTLKVIESRGPHHTAHIRLAGRWVERAGFYYGDYVQVIALRGMVLVVPVYTPSIEHYESDG
jgi:hypothetical protein